MLEVWITTQFEGFHRWPDAPEKFGYLAARHRHIFKVRAWRKVTHDDRDVEFIDWKHQIEELIQRWLSTRETGTWSCEKWATEIGEATDAVRVSVSEDGENGATWRR